ncbi:sigma-70 family RNA polymerase sigma factor [Saccharothrix sp. S26]|uniref:sigma-70 family RNA polymerase sigma factor n=1 Tax=Saccharothrix sp. S26 TaxID=2907215 RepID=UPI001F46CBBB|nr:sigma-70 family RNA polymerase sigma factor [Saccharothrix sp. S26]MCE6998090.1 sigma-70 family RNA polymerase sigma factor [Saccharothrix sp. S26]
MTDEELLATRFEADRGHLRAVAYRVLGSMSEAEDAVQEAWLRLQRADTRDVGNLTGWLTTVVGRVCLDMLRSRASRREDPLDVRVPDPVLAPDDGGNPEHEAVLADSVGLALLVVLEALTPAERLAFVLHDLFALPFDDIAPIVGRTPAAARQLASRARRRVRDGTPVPDALPRQREVVDAFTAAARDGDFEGLLAVLDPDVVLRVDFGALNPDLTTTVRGAEEVARRALMFRRPEAVSRRVLVNGGTGILTAPGGVPASVMGFTVSGGRIVAIDVLADPERLARLDLSGLDLPGRG